MTSMDVEEADLTRATPSPKLVPEADVPRCELYRLLSDPVRVRLLALAEAEELGVGELAELLGEGQPKISRHGAALRDAGLVTAKRNGTWVLLRLADSARTDPVVKDALEAGRRALQRDGTLAKVEEIVRARDDKAREYFARSAARLSHAGLPREIGAYLVALRPLLAAHHLAVDAGTGDGSLLDVLSPLFDRVVAVDRSSAQLATARAHASRGGLANVDFVESELDGEAARAAVRARSARGADVVFASRVLHHAPKPAAAVKALASLLAPGGAFVVLDYAPHEDLALKESQADLWLGFSDDELSRYAESAGLVTSAPSASIPKPFRGEGPDAHLEWRVFCAAKPVKNR